MKVGEKKILSYFMLSLAWIVSLILLESGSCRHITTQCFPSYLAVLFGSYSVLKIGSGLVNTIEFSYEIDKLKGDIERAIVFLPFKAAVRIAPKLI